MAEEREASPERAYLDSLYDGGDTEEAEAPVLSVTSTSQVCMPPQHVQSSPRWMKGRLACEHALMA